MKTKRCDQRTSNGHCWGETGGAERGGFRVGGFWAGKKGAREWVARLFGMYAVQRASLAVNAYTGRVHACSSNWHPASRKTQRLSLGRNIGRAQSKVGTRRKSITTPFTQKPQDRIQVYYKPLPSNNACPALYRSASYQQL